MKFTKNIPLLLLFAILLASCRNDDDQQSSASINDFVWKGLNSWYYWQPNVPNLSDQVMNNSNQYSSIINGKSPDQLFYSLLYNYNTQPRIDRFSWIVNDVNALLASFNGITKSNGMDFSLYYKDAGQVNIVGIVNYVVPGSSAAAAGIVRGDVITKVNNADLTSANYTQLMNDQITVTIADSVSQTSAGIVTTGGQNYSLTASVLEENPIAYYEKFQQNGKTIGYLVYNGFKSNYNDELNAAFATMKADGVNELILDLRYNGGGSVETAVALGSMITGQFTGQPYVKIEFNQKHSQYNETNNFQNKVKTYGFSNGQTVQTGEQTVNSLNLNKVYVLTSSGTASASELTIVGLKAYINVVTIGAETYGKFVGSNTLFDSPSQDYLSYDNRNKSHNWAMQPITFSYFNGNHDPNPTNGIAADQAINSYSYFGTLQEFGNPSDPALNTALNLASAKMPQNAGYSSFQKSKSFLHNSKTMTKFGTEIYIDNMKEFVK